MLFSQTLCSRRTVRGAETVKAGQWMDTYLYWMKREPQRLWLWFLPPMARYWDVDYEYVDDQSWMMQQMCLKMANDGNICSKTLDRRKVWFFTSDWNQSWGCWRPTAKISVGRQLPALTTVCVALLVWKHPERWEFAVGTNKGFHTGTRPLFWY